MNKKDEVEIIDVDKAYDALPQPRRPKNARDIIEKRIADDPLWAAQLIIDYGSHKLIDELLK